MAKNSFATSNLLPSGLSGLCPTGTPWHFSAGLYQRIQGQLNEADQSFKKSLVLPSDPEFEFVWKMFYQEQAPTKYGIKRIFAIHHGGHSGTFERHLQNINRNAMKFPANWQTTEGN